MNRIASKIAMLAVVVGVSACASSSFTTNSDYDRKINFRNYQTYKIEAPKPGKNNDPILNSSLNQRRIEEALVAEMNARGYQPVEQNPDLVVRYITDAEQRQDHQAFNNYWGYWWWSQNNTRVRNYEETRLVVDLVDANTDQLVWQGWATGEIAKSKKDREAAFRKIVYEIMQEYKYRAGSNQVSENATSAQ